MSRAALRWIAATAVVAISVGLSVAARQQPLPGPGDRMPEPEIDLIFTGYTEVDDDQNLLDPSLFAVRTDARVVKLLDDFSSAPAVSPDGSRVAFVHRPSGTDGPGPIISFLDLRTHVTRRLTTEDPAASDFAPTWSPDGEKVAFIRTDGGASSKEAGLWLVSPERDAERIANLPITDLVWEGDSNEHLLTMDFERKLWRVGLDGDVESARDRYPCATLPSWTPNGERYVCVGAGRRSVMFSDGSERSAIARGRGFSHAELSHSGATVAFIVRGRLKITTLDGSLVGEAPHPDVTDAAWGAACDCVAYLAGDRLYHWDPDHHPAPLGEGAPFQGAFDWVH